jgi:hypothetical protein
LRAFPNLENASLTLIQQTGVLKRKSIYLRKYVSFP